MDLFGVIIIIVIFTVVVFRTALFKKALERKTILKEFNKKQKIRAPVIRKGIKKKVEHVYRELGDLNIPVRNEYMLDGEQIKNIKKNKYSEGSLRTVAEDMLRSIGVVHPKIKLFVELDESKEKKKDATHIYNYAFYVLNAEGWAEIHITMKPHYSVNEVAAILAHECTYHFLKSYREELPEMQGNQFLTDIAAVYVGFSDVLIEGYKSRKRISFKKGGDDYNRQLQSVLENTYATSNEIVYISNRINRLRIKDKKKLKKENRRINRFHNYNNKMDVLAKETEDMIKTYDEHINDLLAMLTKINESAIVSAEEDRILKKVKRGELLSFSEEIYSIFKETQKTRDISHLEYERLKRKADLLSLNLKIWVRMLKKYERISAPSNDFNR